MRSIKWEWIGHILNKLTHPIIAHETVSLVCGNACSRLVDIKNCHNQVAIKSNGTILSPPVSTTLQLVAPAKWTIMHVSTALFIDMAHATNAQGLSSVFAPTEVWTKHVTVSHRWALKRFRSRSTYRTNHDWKVYRRTMICDFTLAQSVCS